MTLTKLQGNIVIGQKELEAKTLAILELSYDQIEDAKYKIGDETVTPPTDQFHQILFNPLFVHNQYDTPLSYIYSDIKDNANLYEPELPLVVLRNLGIYRPNIVDSAEVFAIGPQGLDLNAPANSSDNLVLNAKRTAGELFERNGRLFASKNTGQRLIFGAYDEADFYNEDSYDFDAIQNPVINEYFELRVNGVDKESSRVDIISNFNHGADKGRSKTPGSFLHYQLADTYTDGDGVSMIAPHRAFKIFCEDPNGVKNIKSTQDWWKNNWHDAVSGDVETDYAYLSKNAFATANGVIKYTARDVNQRVRVSGTGVRVERNVADAAKFADDHIAEDQYSELQHYGIKSNVSFNIVIGEKSSNPSIILKKEPAEPAFMQSYDVFRDRPRIVLRQQSDNSEQFMYWQYRAGTSDFCRVSKFNTCKKVSDKLYVFPSKESLLAAMPEYCDWRLDLIVDGTMYLVDLRKAIRMDIVAPEEVWFTDHTCLTQKQLDAALGRNLDGDPVCDSLYLAKFFYPVQNRVPTYTINPSGFLEMFSDEFAVPYSVATPPYPSEKAMW